MSEENILYLKYSVRSPQPTGITKYAYTRGAALPQTPLLALIRRESNALGFVVTVVVVAAVVVAAVVVAAVVVAAVVVAAVVVAAVVVAGCAMDRIDRMYSGQSLATVVVAVLVVAAVVVAAVTVAGRGNGRTSR